MRVTDQGGVQAAFVRLRMLAEGVTVAPGSYLVERLDDGGTRFLAHSADGVDALILTTTNSAPVAPLRLQGLSVDYGIDCVLVEKEQPSRIRASVIRSSSELQAPDDLFATFCASVVDRLPGTATDQDLAREVERWARLFWRLSQPGSVTFIGLAGELTCIAEAEDVQQWARSWHARPEDRLDFSFLPSDVTVEVKATSRDRRVHEVSLSQVSEPHIEDRFFTSLRIVEGGLSIGGLIRRIADQLADDEGRLGLWNILTLTCGSSLDDALAFRFDYEVARASIRYYAASDIPCPIVELPLPSGVSNIRFSSDFELARAVQVAVVESALAQ